MKFTCPHCQKEYDLDNAHSGQKARCKKCHQIFIIHEIIQIHPSNIAQQDPVKHLTETVKIKTVNSAKRIWNHSPVQFRNAFLATFGVLSALLITLYIYGGIFHSTSGSASSVQSTPERIKDHAIMLDQARSLLESNGVYHDGSLPKLVTFRGRNLYRTVYSPDANYFVPNMALYTDIHGCVVGCMVLYMSDKTNTDLRRCLSDKLIKESSDAAFVRQKSALNAFSVLISDDPTLQKNFTSMNKDDSQSVIYTKGIWTIEIVKSEIIKNDLYSYMVVAQSW